MQNLDFFAKEHFDLFKLVTFSSVFAVSSVVQLRVPHQNTRERTMKNWSVNLPLALINTILFGMICGSCVCLFASHIKHYGRGIFDIIHIPYGWQIVLSIVLLDLVAYFFHRLYHESRFFWRFHAVHHSDVIYDASTALRFHPAELLFSLTVRLVIIAAFGVPLLGLFLFEGVFILFNLVEHSDIRFPEKVEKLVSKVFVTPSMHRRHHSVELHDLNSNFGTIFTIWDFLFKTINIRKSREVIPVGAPEVRGTFLNPMDLLIFPFSDPKKQRKKRMRS